MGRSNGGGGKEVRMGIGRLWEGAKMRGEEGARGGGISQMDMIECLGGHRLWGSLTAASIQNAWGDRGYGIH